MPKFEKTEPIAADAKPTSLHIPTTLPKVTITYCTQCRWLLRAAYFAQELLSTFDTALGEVALRPTTGGVFTVVLDHVATSAAGVGAGVVDVDGSETATRGDAGAIDGEGVVRVLIWDRKAEGGFPETKVLKQRVRDHVQPGRGLGHSDGHKGNQTGEAVGQAGESVRWDDDKSTLLGGSDGAVSLEGETDAVRGESVDGKFKIGRDDCETCP